MRQSILSFIFHAVEITRAENEACTDHARYCAPFQLRPVVPFDLKGVAVLESVHRNVRLVIARKDLGYKDPVREVTASVLDRECQVEALHPFEHIPMQRAGCSRDGCGGGRSRRSHLRRTRAKGVPDLCRHRPLQALCRAADYRMQHTTIASLWLWFHEKMVFLFMWKLLVWVVELILTFVACLLGICISGPAWRRLNLDTPKRFPRLVPYPKDRVATISVVIPCFNEAEALPRALRWLDETAVVSAMFGRVTLAEPTVPSGANAH